jgi:hypothetical protein
MAGLRSSRPGRDSGKSGQVSYAAAGSGSEFRALAAALLVTRIDGGARAVIQAPKPEPRIMRYELSDYEWTTIKPMLPNKPRGVRRVNDRRVLNGIYWVLRSGAPVARLARDLRSVHHCYNRFVRWRCAGVWVAIMDALLGAML